MVTGLVKWFDAKKGYGFIVGPEGQDVFVHFSQIRGDGFRTLGDEQEVEYEMIQGDKGFQAQNVVPIGVVIEKAVSDVVEQLTSPRPSAGYIR